MTREELLALVNKELGSIKLTLNERAINEELDDSLGDFGEDEAANAKLVTRIANRLKRMDGSVHSAVSHEVEEYKKSFKPKEPELAKQDTKHGGKQRDDLSEQIRQLTESVKEMREERQKERAEAARKSVADSVKKGLRDKLSGAKLGFNDFFANLAVKDLEIPDENPNIGDLVGKAETLYNRYAKEANVDLGAPRSGGGGLKEEKIDEHVWDDIVSLTNRVRPKP